MVSVDVMHHERRKRASSVGTVSRPDRKAGRNNCNNNSKHEYLERLTRAGPFLSVPNIPYRLAVEVKQH